MPGAADALGDKRRPTRIIGDPMGGCRHCGAVVRTENAAGTIIVYRAGAECCPSALQDQIIYCHEEIDRVNAALMAHETNLARLRDEISLTESNVRGDALKRKFKRAEEHMPELRLSARTQLIEIGAQIRELRAKQEELGRNLKP